MDDAHFPKDHRLRKRHEFLSVMRKGRKVVTRHWVFVAKSNGTAQSRLGVTITKRVGGAVVRNRLKRQLREYFRLGGVSGSGLDIVVIGRNSAVDADFLAGRKSFDLGLKKLGELKLEG